MRVVYNALSIRPGVVDGAVTFSVNILAHLPGALEDHELVALVRRGETRLQRAANLSLVEVDLPGNAGARIAYETFALSRALKNHGADLFVSPNESIPLRSPCAIVVVAQNLAYHRQPGQRAFHGTTMRDRLAIRAQAEYYRRRMPAAYSRAARIAAVSKATVDVLSAGAGLDPSKARVIYEGSDSVLMPEPHPVERAGRLLVVSTLAPYKGLERTLELYARLLVERPELELDVVGGDWRGFQCELEARAKVLGIAQSVRFLGNVGPERLAELYETSQLLLHLSECESFGLPVAEAMRYSLPVVSSGQSSLGEVAGGAALELEDDLDEAVRAVIALLASEDARQELSARGRERAAELSWRASAERLAEVVREAATAEPLSRGAG